MREQLNDPATRRQWRRRGEIIEPRFGQLKAHDGFRGGPSAGWRT